jgi:UDP-N-acetylglucosamine:LPS N-acetylglucosamine transferase
MPFTKSKVVAKSTPLIDFWVFGPERGCLMREIPIIRKIRENQRIRIRLFVHPRHVELVHQLLPGDDTECLAYPGGVTFSYKPNLDFDTLATAQSILAYIFWRGWKDYFLFRKALKRERPSLVVNDFLPLVPIYARLHKIRVIGIYNYLLEETSFGRSLWHRILSFNIDLFFPIIYRSCEQMILERIIPPAKDRDNIHFVSPIARDVTCNIPELRLKITDSDLPLVFLSLGGGNTGFVADYLEHFRPIARAGQVQFLLSPRSSSEEQSLKETYPEFIIANSGWNETQDLIAACDLVIARTGFTTVAETLKARVPLLIWHLESHPEIRETEVVLLEHHLAAGVLYADDSEDMVSEKVLSALAVDGLAERLEAIPANGADQAAELMTKYL